MFVLVTSLTCQEECERVLKNYHLRDHVTLILLKECTVRGESWPVELDNNQKIFRDVVGSYFGEVMLFDLADLGAVG